MTAGLASRFRGSLLGLAIGDALGSRFEGRDPEWIARCHASFPEVVDDPPAELRYTDDTQMAIAVAEALADDGRIDAIALGRRFAAGLELDRGYGRGTRRVLDALRVGLDASLVARTVFPGGSYGNGAAMRVAPVGLCFHGDLDRVWAEARLQSLPTHVHPLAIEGAQVLAVAVALAVRGEPLTPGALLARGVSSEFADRIERAFRIVDPASLVSLGNGFTACESVPTAIACHLVAASYPEAIGRAILLGGDADTIAAMAGAITGASCGIEGIPVDLVDRLEDGEDRKGRTYIEALSTRLLVRAGKS